MTETLLDARNVGLALPSGNLAHRSYHQILSGISFSLSPRESLAIVGPSGSGKSVLLRVLAGLLLPTTGEVHFQGKPLYPVPRGGRRNLARQLGMAFQKGGLIDALTVYENLALPLREVTELCDGEIRETISRSLDSVGLSGTEELKPEELSGGMQKRLGVARAFLMAESLVILDDPTAGLDPVTAVAILDLVTELQSEKKLAMVLVGSQPEEVLPLCDRVAFLEEGCLTAFGTVKEVTASAKGTMREFFERGLP